MSYLPRTKCRNRNRKWAQRALRPKALDRYNIINIPFLGDFFIFICIQNKYKYIYMYTLYTFLWKPSPQKNNSSSRKSETSSAMEKKSRSEPSRPPSDMLLPDRSQYFSVPSSRNDGSTAIPTMRYDFPLIFVVRATKSEIFPSSEVSLAGCRYSPKEISKPRFPSRRNSSSLRESIFFSELRVIR